MSLTIKKLVPLESGGKSTSNQSATYDPQQEGILGTIGRTAYKPVRETAKLAGFPGSLWNTLGGIANTVSQQYPGLELSQVPMVPNQFTMQGVQQNVLQPLENKVMGKGYMDPREGLMDQFTTRTSQILPWMLGGGTSALASLGLSGLQAGAGLGAKELGIGETGQALAELGAGTLGPIAGKLSRIPAKSGALSEKLWQQTESKAETLGTMPLDNFYRTAEETFNSDMFKKIPLSGKKFFMKEFSDIERGLGGEETRIQDLINTATRLNNLYPSINKYGKEAKAVIGKFKSGIYQDLDNMISTYPEARAISQTIYSTPSISNAIDKIKDPRTKQLVEYGIKAGKLMAIPGVVLGHNIIGNVALGLTGGALAAKKGYDIGKLLEASPTLRKEVLDFSKTIAKGNFDSLPSKIDSINNNTSESSNSGSLRITKLVNDKV
jgi:hypothetical protein